MPRAHMVLFLLALAPLACADTEGAIRVRASNEFHCPQEQVALTARPELTSNTFDVSACGSVARYTCARGYYSSSDAICIREPIAREP
jgi:hypothetical protein